LKIHKEEQRRARGWSFKDKMSKVHKEPEVSTRNNARNGVKKDSVGRFRLETNDSRRNECDGVDDVDEFIEEGQEKSKSDFYGRFIEDLKKKRRPFIYFP
jgi:hypothetical protein